MNVDCPFYDVPEHDSGGEISQWMQAAYTVDVR
jgi:hypothetical protein